MVMQRRKQGSASNVPIIILIKALLRHIVPRPVRHFLRRPVVALRWLAHLAAGRLGRRHRIEMQPGWTITAHPAAIEAFATERDQPELRAELEGFLGASRPGMVLFDIGAHYGLFAIAALHATRGDAQIVSVDPSPPALEIFDVNMQYAGAGDRVQRLRAAIGERDGSTSLLTSGPGGWHMMVPPSSARPDTVEVPMMTLLTLSARTGLVPTHVKIDVEGEEDAVLRGGEPLLRAHHPIVFLELHAGILRRSGRSPAAVLSRLRSYGYDRLTIGGRAVADDEIVAADVARILATRGHP